jgi:hypothetical protein
LFATSVCAVTAPRNLALSAGESAQNLALIRKLVLNLLRRETSVQVGIAATQKRAGWDHNYLLKIWHRLYAIALQPEHFQWGRDN